VSIESMQPIYLDDNRSASDVNVRVTMPISPADEKRIAKELSPGVAWPTLVLAIVLPSLTVGVVWLGLAGLVPLWVCTIILTFATYGHYTLTHESVHGNLVPAHPKLRWLNDVVGWISALGQGLNWPMLMRAHLMHHSHTNTDEDPDIWVKGGFAMLLLKSVLMSIVVTIPLFILRYLSPKDYKMAVRDLRGSEVIQSDVVAVAVLVLLAIAIPTGHFMDWLFLLFLPSRLGGTLLAIFFSWLPHHPFDSTERYLNTRVSLWPCAGLLTFQQNLHLMHHLWPSVPFYNYGRLYQRLRPNLIAKGSRIEGLRPMKAANI